MASEQGDRGSGASPPPKRKKGVRNEHLYSANVRKEARRKGCSYITVKGTEIQARATGNDCNCRRKCFEQISEDDRLNILAQLSEFQTKNEQDVHLTRLIQVIPVARRRARGPEPKSRQSNFQYKVLVRSLKKEVCKKAFESLHGIKAKRVRRLTSLLLQNKNPTDNRGKNVKGNAISPEVCEQVRQHIDSFPKKEVRYWGQTREYLHAELTVKQMHDMFKMKYFETKVKYEFYLNFFKENFNLSFERPQIDTCSRCEELNNKIKSAHLADNVKKANVVDLLVHRIRAKKFYDKMQEVAEQCKNKPNVAGIVFDYMQVTYLPRIPVQEIFYYRQLEVNVFGIHSLKDNSSKMYVYHEGVANKSSNEVCSFLQHYIANEIPQEVSELNLFCDNCAEQGENGTIARFCLGLISSGRFHRINHYLPLRGHSFMPCDLDFGMIKTALKHHDRIYVPQELSELIKTAGKNFTVQEVINSDIIDFKSWWPLYYKRNTISEESQGRDVRKEDKVTFAISKFHMLQYSQESMGLVKTWEFIDGCVSHRFNLALRSGIVPPLPRAKAYTGQVPILENKIQDIRACIQYIPEQYLPFYHEILSWSRKSRENESNEQY